MKVPLEMTARATSGRLHLFAGDGEVVLTMPPARTVLAAPRGLDFVREVAEWLDRDVGWDLPAPRAVTVTCRFLRTLDKDGRTWRRHLLTLRRGRTASTVHLDVARARASWRRQRRRPRLSCAYSSRRCRSTSRPRRRLRPS
jgi:hypothetical protein